MSNVVELTPNKDLFIQWAQNTIPLAIIVDPEYLDSENLNTFGTKGLLIGSLLPRSIDELKIILQGCNRYLQKIHPISTGRNWGFGSKLPYQANTWLLDLSLLQNISEYDSQMGTVCLEPGVTQRQLIQYLEKHHSDFILDVTGSSADTSIVGNTLERGIAYNSLRINSVIRLRVLTMGGDEIDTGYGAWPEARVTNLFPSAPGPGLESLFFQSNLGIVTSVTIQLARKPQHEIFFNFNFSQKDLPKVVEAFGTIKKQYPWQSIVHIANRGRTGRMSLMILQAIEKQLYNSQGLSQGTLEKMNRQFPLEWIAIGSIKGPKALTRDILKQIRLHLAGRGKLISFTESKLSFALQVSRRFKLRNMQIALEFSRILSGLSQGRPTNATIHGFFSPDQNFGADHPQAPNYVDSSPIGFIYCVPLAPLNGEAAEALLNLVTEHCKTWHFTPEVTFNTITSTVLEGVFSVSFHKSDEAEKNRAHHCIRELHKNLINQGFFPYRLPVGLQDFNLQSESQKKLLRQIKSILDPNSLVDPMRSN